jgi:hypothetical protein
MIESIQANRCTCWCGQTWISESVPKRCAGKGKHRDWNSRDPRPAPKIIVSKTESELDPFAEPAPVSQIEKPAQEKPKSSGSKIAESLLAQMARKLGRPSHATNCSCFVCKPPKAVK